MAEGYKDWTSGDVLTAADLEDYTVKQSIMRFASAAARNSALASVLSELMVAGLLDTNSLSVYSGSAWSTIGPVHGPWTSFTPTWSGTIGNGTLAGAYRRVGRDIKWRVSVTWGTTTSHAASDQTFGLPVAAAAIYVNCPIGQAGVNISANNYAGEAWIASSTTFKVRSGTASFWTNTGPATFTNGNAVVAQGFYEAAADA